MCGIAGFCGIGDREVIQRMTDALYHRGPDSGGIHMDGKVALGHRRLAILDIQGGAQPMFDPASGLVMVYNGEVYNHMELRRELESAGQVFSTSHSDTETVLKAFAHWGCEAFARFNGMYAVAIYSPQQQKIWLARDRFGEKPLFYVQNSHGFAFASEICALWQWPGYDKSIDEANLQRFFAWNYLPAAGCLSPQCKSLPPGSWLALDVGSGSVEVKSYWEFTLEPDESLHDEEALAGELRRLLIQSVKRRFLSDVPVGIFLSGGIDSSAILAAATHAETGGELSAYTIGFEEKSFDESGKAKKVAEYFHVRHYIRYLTQRELEGAIGPILSHMSEPFGDASLIPTALLSAFARQHVKVALSGDGGDELFGGYDPLAAIAPATLYRHMIPAWLTRIGRRLASLAPASDRNMSLEFRIRRMLRGLAYPEKIQLPVWMSGLDPGEIEEYFYKPLNAAQLFAAAVSLWDKYAAASGLEKAFLFFTRIYLPNDILVKSDRASMAHSLESRAVFLDNDLVDFARRLPMRYKYRHGRRKYLLKKALGAWLPQEIINQPKKGFGIPLNRWLRSLPAPVVSVPGLKPGVIESCMNAHNRRSGDFRYFLWDLQAYAHLIKHKNRAFSAEVDNMQEFG